MHGGFHSALAAALRLRRPAITSLWSTLLVNRRRFIELRGRGNESQRTTTIDHPDVARRNAGAVSDATDPDPEVPERARGPRRFPAAYKARILVEYETLNKAEKGELLRREGSTPRSSPSGAVSATKEATRHSPGAPVVWRDRSTRS